jgi:alkylation response protein AidB-like acyl-CoA dehydrogenase
MADADPDPAHFRAVVRGWLEENFPSELAGRDPTPLWNDPELASQTAGFDAWNRRIASVGWGVPAWPKRFGGAEFDADQVRILAEEMATAGAFNPVRGIGSVMLGPTLLEFGTEAQKVEHLPSIARGERRWCQGYSEPGAGSDLASLQMRCTDEGDVWRVSGQKIWTSGANHADWCFALVRTDTASKQGGISFLLIDMRSPGIDARPIRLISGSTHFCEVFFTEVAVPKANLVGEVNKGWSIAKRLMQFERTGLSEGRGEGASLVDLASHYIGRDTEGRIADLVLRQRMVDHAMRARAYTLTLERKMADAEVSGGLAADSSALKNLGSMISQMRSELVVDIMGVQGLGWDGEEFNADEIDATRAWLYSRAFSIYGGSHEIQNNITAKRVLGLPDR